MATPKFDRPGKGKAWAPAVKALVVVCAEECDGDIEKLRDLLNRRARWPNGLPVDPTLRKWARDAGIDLGTGNPEKSATTQAARAARYARLERHREELSETIGARILPRSAALIVRRLEEQDAVEGWIADARGRLEEALTMEKAAEGMNSDDVRAARRQVTIARLMLEVERDGRIPFRDLIRLTHVGIAQHLALEGLADEEDDETNPIIVEIHIPRPDAIEAQAVAVPQGELPERTD